MKADPAAKSPPFLTFSPLDFLGPARLTIRTRGQISGAGSVSYRIRHETDFDPKKRVAFEWKPETTTTRIGATSRLIHLRIYLPANTPQVEIERITLQREGQPPQIWDFTKQP